MENTEEAAKKLLASDPAGPVPEPDLPPELKTVAERNSVRLPDESTPGNAVNYSVECESPEAPELCSSFTQISLLERLKDSPLYSLAGVEMRLKTSLKEGANVLNSYGYYEGKVRGDIILPSEPGEEAEGTVGKTKGHSVESSRRRSGVTREEAAAAVEKSRAPVTVKVTFTPGPQYKVGKTSVVRSDLLAKPGDSEAGQIEGIVIDMPLFLPLPPDSDVPPLPLTLADAGLPAGAPAHAADVQKSVDASRDIYRNSGFPHAAVASTRYVLDTDQKELEADVRIRPGEFMRMGGLERHGAEGVRASYLEALKTWERGQPWDQSRIEAFRDALRRSGLFQTVELVPGEEEDESGNRPVVATLSGALERTYGGALKYDTSFGVGVQGFWEHRNLTGYGDRLRLDMPIWQDMQELTATYRRPFFMRNDQDFIAQGGMVNQSTDAYDLQAGRLVAGIDRRLGRRWSVTVQGSVEGGRLKDPDKPRRNYFMYGLPLSASYSSANGILDATRGGRATFSVAPYSGTYEGDFNVVRGRVDLQRFIPLVGEDKLVLALRGSFGSLAGADSAYVPPALRFYSGGGGSVRGYEYQSIGPRNSDDDPLGGGSLLEFSVEPRYKVAETWGIVAFLDGGMVYDGEVPDTRAMRFGAGLGFRYYTAIGPVRFDVATPLNPRDDDKTLQFYISIGQSF